MASPRERVARKYPAPSAVVATAPAKSQFARSAPPHRRFDNEAIRASSIKRTMGEHEEGALRQPASEIVLTPHMANGVAEGARRQEISGAERGRRHCAGEKPVRPFGPTPSSLRQRGHPREQ